MERLGGFIERIGLAMAGKRNPWGNGPKGDGPGSGGGDDGGEDAPSGESDAPKPRGPRNPWLPEGGGEREPRRSANIEDIFRTRGPEGPRRGKGGPGGGGGPRFTIPRRPDGKSWLPLIGGAVVAGWLLFSSVHQVAPKEQGVVTTLGRYTRTLQPGLNFTFPWPIQQVAVEPVSTIRSFRIPESGEEKLILTSDQNLVDLSYVVRWYISDLTNYQFRLAEPEQTIAEVAEAAMRASVAEKTLDETLSGAGRAEIQQRVQARMQAILDAYKAGVTIEGVQIEKTDPPERVIEAFKDVSTAQQDADADINRARAYAQQLLAKAQGDATAFDKIYAEYKLAPEVTRRRLYYETMEAVLSKTDKTVIEAQGVTPYLPLPEVKRRAQQPPLVVEGK
jgi:membrane protease subunit HflK